MLREAVELAEQGRAVYVISCSHRDAEQLENLIGIEKSQKLGIKFESIGSNYFDWESLRVRGSHPNCIFLVDHWAIESRFGKLLEMLHRYDP